MSWQHHRNFLVTPPLRSPSAPLLHCFRPSASHTHPSLNHLLLFTMICQAHLAVNHRGFVGDIPVVLVLWPLSMLTMTLGSP